MIQLVNSGETVGQTVIGGVSEIWTQIVYAGEKDAAPLSAEALSIPVEAYAADYENLTIGTGYETEYIELYDSETATGITINQGGTVVLEAYPEDILPVLSDSTVNAGGLIDLNGGRIENIIVNDQGTIESLSWNEYGLPACEAFNVTINSGGKFLQYVGEAENTQVKTGGVYQLGFFDPPYSPYDDYNGYIRADKDHVNAENTVVDGGIFYDYWYTVNNTTVNAGTFNVHGGIAKSTTVSAEGTLNLYSFDYSVYEMGVSICQTDAGIAEDTVVNGGRMYLSENTMAKNTRLEAGGRMFMTGNSIAEGVTISGNSALFLSNGAEAKDVTVNGGMAHIGTGASAVNVTITSGSLYLYGGAILDGTINVSGTLVLEDVTMNYGAVEFQLASDAASQGIMIDNLSLLKGGSVILSADSTQEFGTYRFAGNAGAYTDSIALSVGGVEHGELSLNGDDL